VQNKVFGVFGWEGEGVITLVKTRATGQQGREYGAEDVKGVKGYGFQMRQISQGGMKLYFTQSLICYAN